jgi:hypothetical protein
MLAHIALSNGAQTAVGFLLWGLIIVAYLDAIYHHGIPPLPNMGQVAVVNGLLGWTFIG